ERTYRDGKLAETKIDRAKIIQQLGLLVLAVPALLFAVWRSWTAHQQARAALEQARIAADNAKLAERGQHVDRYQKAAAMLDSEQLSVRRAAIYALRELALSDPEGHLALTRRLLCAFARDRSIELRRSHLEREARRETGADRRPDAPEDVRDAVEA